MASHVIEINRKEAGDDHHVLFCLDIISTQNNLPKFDKVYLSTDHIAQVLKSNSTKNSEFHLVLPIAVIPFLSINDFHITLRWSFLMLEKSKDPIFELIAKFGSEECLSTVVKTKVILKLWAIFLESEKFYSLATKEPNGILFAFRNILESSLVKEEIQDVISESPEISQYLKKLSGSRISTIMNASSNMSENNIFMLSDEGFIELAATLFLEIHKSNIKTG